MKPDSSDAEDGKRRRLLWQMVWRPFAVVGVVAVCYFVIARANQNLFTPVLEIRGVAAPAGPVDADTTVRLALQVKNIRFKQGAGYVVAIVDEDTEVEGRVAAVPARKTVEIPVELNLTPGRHVVALILFDAWQKNVKVGRRRGITVQVGTSNVRAFEAQMPREIRAGETLPIKIVAANIGSRKQYVIPLAVFQPVKGGPSVEVEGSAAHFFGARDSAIIHMDAPTRKLKPGKYFLAIVFLDPKGVKTGQGLYRLPLTVR